MIVNKYATGGSGSGGTYVLPIATANRLGGVKVGDGLSIDPSTGVLSASGSSAGGDAHILLSSSSTPAGIADGDVYAKVFDATEWSTFNNSETGQTAFRWASDETHEVKADGFIGAWGEGGYGIKWDDGHWYSEGEGGYVDLGTDDVTLSIDGGHSLILKTEGGYCYMIPDEQSMGFWRNQPAGDGAEVEQTFDYGDIAYGVYQMTMSAGSLTEKALAFKDEIPTLPVASASILGGVKVGNGLAIDSNGVLSANGGAGGDATKLLPIDSLPVEYNWVSYADDTFNVVRENCSNDGDYLMHWDSNNKYKGVQISNGEFNQSQGYGMAVGADGKAHCTDPDYANITAWIEDGKLYWDNPYGVISMLDAYGVGSDQQGAQGDPVPTFSAGTVVATTEGLHQVMDNAYTHYVHSDSVVKIWKGSQADYNALGSGVTSDTLYIIL